MGVGVGVLPPETVELVVFVVLEEVLAGDQGRGYR